MFSGAPAYGRYGPRSGRALHGNPAYETAWGLKTAEVDQLMASV